jgi:hypothetical protein
VAQYVKQAQEHLSFLRFLSPRINIGSNNESGVFVVREGKVVSGAAERLPKQGFRGRS